MTKLYKKTTNTIIDENGQVSRHEEIDEVFIPREEPNFVKLYLDHVLVQARTKVDLSPLLMEILKLANYADDERGGMYIVLNKYAKQLIGSRIDMSLQMIDKNIKQFVSSKVLMRIARGTYLLNPYYFGKGHWTDIKKIRATIDFNTGEFIPKLEFGVRDGGGEILEGFYQDEAGNIVDVKTGEIQMV